jgi:hypothetical protein
MRRAAGLKAKFKIIGPNPRVPQLACSDVEVLRYVPDPTPTFTSPRITVVPIRFGAGVKTKLGMSMGHGVPVVAAPIAAKGIEREHGTSVIVSQTPEALAACILDAVSGRSTVEFCQCGPEPCERKGLCRSDPSMARRAYAVAWSWSRSCERHDDYDSATELFYSNGCLSSLETFNPKQTG